MTTRTLSLARLALAITLSLAPALAGCIPTSKTPIGDPAKARFDADLAGLWRFELKKGDEAEGPFYLALAPREGGGVEACMFGTRGGPKGLDLGLYRGFMTRAGDRRFLSVVPLLTGSDVADAGKQREHYLLCYEVAGGKARMGIARLEPLIAAVEAGKLKGTAKREPVSTVALDDTPEALLAHFSAGKVEDHFDMSLSLVRIEAGPAPAPAPAPTGGK